MLDPVKNICKEDAKSGADHGQKDLAEEYSKDARQGCLDQAPAPSAPARAQAVEQGNLSDCGQGIQASAKRRRPEVHSAVM